ncbi:hypothetical protein [Parvularcula maris]|uniref:Uncharacterized protein n=1 Tax=Parvularcula maris TaxID=2965077 RepID=A0A9X2RL78_9PROT|nr:hypothetical protein [Parvularcula maris]MCQ8186543.1 hypothetical protein [Parvularcula maris]
MGFNISYGIFKGIDECEVLSRLSLKADGRSDFYLEEELAGAPLGNGLYFVFAQDLGFFLGDTWRTKSEWYGEAYSVVVTETSMVAQSTKWDGNNKIWQVTHDSQQSIRHLETIGTVPSSYQKLVREAEAKQAAEPDGPMSVDWFYEVPVELVRLETGFRYDLLHDAVEKQAEVLRPAP